MCCLSAGRGGTEASGSREVTLQNGKQETWFRFLGKGIPTQQPNTFHSYPKNANRNLGRPKWTACSGKSKHLLPLLVSVSIQEQQVVGPGKTSTFLVLSLQLQAPKHIVDVKREETERNFVRASENV